MRHIVGTAIVMTLAAGIAMGQTKDHNATVAGDAEQALMRIEQEMLAALLKSDPSANQRYIAENAVLTTPDGEVLGKARLVADVKSADLKFEASAISDMKVTVHGDTAVVTYMTTDKGTYKGKDISGKYRWTDVFMRRGGNWQLIAGHGTPVGRP
jgi:ketosteroid isomerase-like protein